MNVTTSEIHTYEVTSTASSEIKTTTVRANQIVTEIHFVNFYVKTETETILSFSVGIGQVKSVENLTLDLTDEILENIIRQP